MRKTWWGTRQKLVYFRQELQRADGDFKCALERLHRELLSDVISCLVRQGERILSAHGAGNHHIQRWNAIWLKEIAAR
ncbi:hypothetical protein [Lewinella sp. IMCC34183]|uniref:hypothetical protein n=1 Tax=Lewinella sp. IMCC34183 TaxID=2248762 RepID=UPI0013003B0E|nr:hypothetical protein [Lewinella sp. IMCC34183]